MDLSGRPTVAELHGDNQWTDAAKKNWLKGAKPVKRVLVDAFQTDVWEPLEKEGFPYNVLLLLESLQIVERYLWSGFNGDSSNQHVLLLSILLNVKRRENLPAWALLADRPDDFALFFERITALCLDRSQPPRIRTHLLSAVIGAFQTLDNEPIRRQCAPLVSIRLWHHLHSEKARNELLDKHGQFKKAWKAAAKRYDAAEDSLKTKFRFQRDWLYALVLDFLNILNDETRQSPDSRVYCERFLEFLTDLQSQFPTRRYVNTLLKDLNLLAAIKLSGLYQDEESGLLRDFTVLLAHYTHFPIDDHTGKQLSRQESIDLHSARIAQLQRTALTDFNEDLKLLSLSSHGLLSQRDELKTHFQPLEDAKLRLLAQQLGYRTEYPKNAGLTIGRELLMEILLSAHETRSTFQETIASMTIMPTEESFYEASFLRNEQYDGSRPMAIPKLNLQYLTVGDFLWRSLILFRCESFYAVKLDIEETVKRVQPFLDQATGQTRFRGRSKMALPIAKPAIVEVVPPRVGDEVPAQVKAEVVLDVARLPHNLRRDWQSVRTDDVVFLLAIDGSKSSKLLTNGNSQNDVESQTSYQYLRSAVVRQVLDGNGKPLRNTVNTNGYYSRSQQVRLIVDLDTIAYHRDASQARKGKHDIYESINLIVRRHSRENNFKPILESIRDLTLSEVPMPSWLQDAFLGLGDPAGATYKQLPNALKSLDFRDTFLNWQHLKDSLPGQIVEADAGFDTPLPPPFILRTQTEASVDAEIPSKRRKKGLDPSERLIDGSNDPTRKAISGDIAAGSVSKSSKKRRIEELQDHSNGGVVKVSTYKPVNMGPYPTDQPKVNTIKFTPAQVEAITSGTQPGLTIIVGPPGTGKTDVATQIINNIYHDFPQERTLLIAHSNQALNQLFQKIVALDIDERHLLRLGHGEEELETQSSFSKFGRVDSFLEIGAKLLAEVARLAASLRITGAHGNSCETAAYFNTVHIKPAWTKYWDMACLPETSTEVAVESFPFRAFFSNAPQPIFPPNAPKEDVLDIAAGCNRHLEKMFSELADIRPFEVLRYARDKANYLLVKEARIIAMTATHAAIRRQEIANLGFNYDNVIMEEAAQITEIENFIPLALQKPEGGEAALKRIVLCGDHLQNSPIIQNAAFRQYANLEQSMFLRLVRLGVPTVLLDKQGRARPGIAELYKWRYPGLGDLLAVKELPEFQTANAGFRYDYQFIHVANYKGKGEMEPTPHFIQNLGEAEYVVAMFMYMRLLGYPGSKISILTTYAGQRALIRDVLNHRCSKNRLFGLPRIVTTVDKYQGEQNDYILLSLTRSKRIGYLRDIRRLTVALSRARLGLYVFGRREVFEACLELKESFDKLFERPDKLQLVTGETFPTTRKLEDNVESVEMEGLEHLGKYVYEMTQAKIASLKGGEESLPEPEETIEKEDDEDDDVAPLSEPEDMVEAEEAMEFDGQDAD